MKMNMGVVSAMLGVALLAAPITASAHEDWRNRGPARAYNSYRHEFAPRANVNQNWAPRAEANDSRWHRHDGGAWRDGYRPVAAPNCAMGAPYNSAPMYNNQQGYYPQAYNAAPAYYPQAYNPAPAPYVASMPGSMPGKMGNLITQRDNAQMLYQQALRNGNRVRAKHLNNDVVALNKRIANNRNRNGYGAKYGSFDQPYASANGTGYGYPNSNLNALSPMLRNFMP